MEYSVFTIFSVVKHDTVVRDILNRFHVPHFSTEMVTEKEMMERPFSLYMGPSKEDMTRAVETTVTALTRPGEKVALITHQSSILLTSSLLANLQKDRLDVTVEDLVEKDIRPNLVRIRKRNIKMIIVDVAADLVKPFTYQVRSTLCSCTCIKHVHLYFRHCRLVCYRARSLYSSQHW